MIETKADDQGYGLLDHLRLTGADLRHIRRRAALDLLDERDPEKLIRLLDAVYWNGYRAGVARRAGRTGAPAAQTQDR